MEKLIQLEKALDTISFGDSVDKETVEFVVEHIKNLISLLKED